MFYWELKTTLIQHMEHFTFKSGMPDQVLLTFRSTFLAKLMSILQTEFNVYCLKKLDRSTKVKNNAISFVRRSSFLKSMLYGNWHLMAAFLARRSVVSGFLDGLVVGLLDEEALDAGLASARTDNQGLFRKDNSARIDVPWCNEAMTSPRNSGNFKVIHSCYFSNESKTVFVSSPSFFDCFLLDSTT